VAITSLEQTAARGAAAASGTSIAVVGGRAAGMLSAR
jgi:hypothetical protein